MSDEDSSSEDYIYNYTMQIIVGCEQKVTKKKQKQIYAVLEEYLDKYSDIDLEEDQENKYILQNTLEQKIIYQILDVLKIPNFKIYAPPKELPIPRAYLYPTRDDYAYVALLRHYLMELLLA